jgi:chromosome partitioning protein
MAHVFALAMQKGGVGKTTTTLNLGVGLARRGARVLLIDLDPQANLTEGLGVDPRAFEYSSYELLLNPRRGAAFATLSTRSGVDLVPATVALAGAEQELAGTKGRELLLRRALPNAHKQYDYILIDSPPSLGLFTLNALIAADAVIVPLQAHVYALRSMPQLEAVIALAHRVHERLAIGGIVCTFVDRRTNLSQVVEQQIRARYGKLVFETVIPISTRLAEAPAAGEPISSYAPASPGALAYAGLANEVEVRYAH